MYFKNDRIKYSNPIQLSILNKLIDKNNHFNFKEAWVLFINFINIYLVAN